MKRISLLFVCLCLSLVAVVGTSSSAGSISDTGAFDADCTFSHRLPDDPIVFPGSPGESHSHDFFGDPRLNAYSTNPPQTVGSPHSIRNDIGTCVRFNSPFTDSDRSGYWAPSLYDGATPVTPTHLGAYYTTGRRDDPTQIKPFPADLRIIAGDKTGQQPAGLWQCDGATVDPGSSTVAPTCATQGLHVTLRFPDCWDGVNSDSPDHKSHMAYSFQASDGSQACPADHSVEVPLLTVIVSYPTFGGPSIHLSTGAVGGTPTGTIATMHADFMNGWDMDRFDGLVARCLNADKYCGGSDGPVPGKS